MDGDQTVFCNGYWIRRVRHADGTEAWHVDGTAVDGGSNGRGSKRANSR